MAEAGTLPIPIGWAEARREALARQPLCLRCGKQAIDVDHIIPRRLGGGNEAANLQPLCKSCHSRKTAKENAERPAPIVRSRYNEREGALATSRPIKEIQEELLLTTDEAARVLRVPPDTVRNLYRVRQLRGVKLGKHLRWSMADLVIFANGASEERVSDD